jgi:MinD superfamily P-loop ATPase
VGVSRPFRIAVASGKGGTGKTTVATSLATVLADDGRSVGYVDCDVEEPNGHLFLAPSLHSRRVVTTSVPEVDESRCNRCGACGAACRFSAIVPLPNRVLTFPKLCHSCGGCVLACEEQAIREVPRAIGVVEGGDSGPLAFAHGRLDVGEAMAPPLIRALLEAAPQRKTLVLDAPPGTSCPVIASIQTADVVLLVTEPTPFGLNDLALAVDAVRALGLPFGVVVNRAGCGETDTYDYCAQEGVPVLLEIPDDRRIARAYSRGELLASALPGLRSGLLELFEKLQGLAADTPKRELRPRRVTVAPGATGSDLPSAPLPIGPPQKSPELVVVSGKGGTGKTSITASLSALCRRVAIADCDVDAADLHLVLEPTVLCRFPFVGGKTALLDPTRCNGCGTCAAHCRFEAIQIPAAGSNASYEIDAVACEGCGVCVDVCPEQAVTLASTIDGQWFVSETRQGPMAHARLGIAEPNSGKLVSLVRQEAKALAVSKERELLICDGPPGIGCPVIASVAGARLALIVTEPTLSGLHDLRRIADLCRQLAVEAAVCINKADINSEVSDQIEAEAAAREIPVLGRIRYDEAVTAAQIRRRAVVEHGEGPAAHDIRALWARLKDALGQSPRAVRLPAPGLLLQRG